MQQLNRWHQSKAKGQPVGFTDGGFHLAVNPKKTMLLSPFIYGGL